MALINNANKEIFMSVKTPGGLTERQTLKNIVLQRDTWGSIMASVQVDSIGKELENSGLGYMYKDTLPISLLGLVDDIVGVTETGYKAQQMNVIINVRTAEKCLQFGVTKCKKMIIGKTSHEAINNDLYVDKWTETYEDDKDTGEVELVEEYSGDTELGQTDEQKYLGFIVSSKGDNMANIKDIKNK